MFQIEVDANGCLNLSRVPPAGAGVAVGGGAVVGVDVGGMLVAVGVDVLVGVDVGMAVRVAVGVGVLSGVTVSFVGSAA